MTYFIPKSTLLRIDDNKCQCLSMDKSDTYFNLDGLYASVMILLRQKGPQSQTQLIHALLDEYNVKEEILSLDVKEALGDLLKKNLIESQL